MMRRLLLLCAAVFLTSVGAMAQSDVSSIADPSPASALPASPQVSGPALTDWELSFTYQFNRFNMPANTVGKNTIPAFKVNDNGYDVSLTRYVVRWGGLEADAAEGFGSTSTPLIKDAKSLFIGGGAHFAMRGRGRIQPWGHVLVGLEHFRFSQTSVQYGSNNSAGFIGGGGADFHLNARTAIRLQADYLVTALFHVAENNWQVGGGLVFSF